MAADAQRIRHGFQFSRSALQRLTVEEGAAPDTPRPPEAVRRSGRSPAGSPERSRWVATLKDWWPRDASPRRPWGLSSEKMMRSIASSVLTDEARGSQLDGGSGERKGVPCASSGMISQSCQLFSEASRSERAVIRRHLTPLFVSAGSTLVREGARGDEFMVLLDGNATVSQGGQTIATLERGDLVGEMALLEADGVRRRNATVTVSTDVAGLRGVAERVSSDSAGRALGGAQGARHRGRAQRRPRRLTAQRPKGSAPERRADRPGEDRAFRPG